MSRQYWLKLMGSCRMQIKITKMKHEYFSYIRVPLYRVWLIFYLLHLFNHTIFSIFVNSKSQVCKSCANLDANDIFHSIKQLLTTSNLKKKSYNNFLCCRADEATSNKDSWLEPLILAQLVELASKFAWFLLSSCRSHSIGNSLGHGTDTDLDHSFL